MQRKINTNITIDYDIYSRISDEQLDFSGSFSKAANHYMRLGLDRAYELELEAAVDKDNMKRNKQSTL